MTEYDITINGYESGLARNAVEDVLEEYFPDADSVEVRKSVQERSDF
jgi:hypothetical protein